MSRVSPGGNANSAPTTLNVQYCACGICRHVLVDPTVVDVGALVDGVVGKPTAKVVQRIGDELRARVEAGRGDPRYAAERGRRGPHITDGETARPAPVPNDLFASIWMSGRCVGSDRLLLRKRGFGSDPLKPAFASMTMKKPKPLGRVKTGWPCASVSSGVSTKLSAVVSPK